MFLKLYLISLPIFFVIDMLWLGVFAKNFYAKHLGFLMTKNIIWPAAIIFYLIFIAGLILFVITPALEKSSPLHALIFGALFGLITYATYDLTNLATIKDWPVIVTVVDLIWGMGLSAAVSIIVYAIAARL